MSPFRVPLSQRPLDKLYFLFFVAHIPITLFNDGVAIYPSHLVPQFLQDFMAWYITFSGDPLIGGLASGTREMYWFRSFIFLEVFFQLPVFVVAAWCLYHNKRWVYPLLIIYGASTSTTLLPCIYHLLNPLTPTPSLLAPKPAPPFSLSSLLNATPSRKGELSNLQLVILLSSYIPFFLLPFGMTIDISRRVGKLLKRQEPAEKAVKSQ